jgi:signal transduction histidine kinase/CheY-like chemotaxis protein/cell division protein FtsB
MRMAGIHIQKKISLIFAGIGFSIAYWRLESVRDVFVFNKGSLPERIFSPDPMSFWMRLLIVFVLMLFSAYVQTLKGKIEKQTTKESRPRSPNGIILSGLAFGALYWVLESIRDVLIYGQGSIFQRIIMPDAMGFWMRLLAVFIIFLFSVYAQNLINQKSRAEENLKKAHDELEKLISERTAELMKSNSLLQQEIAERNRIEEELRRVNCALKTLTECNQVIVRADNESALLNSICQIILDVGGYHSVWIGFEEWNGKHIVRSVSKAGNISDELIDEIHIIPDEFKETSHPVIHVIKTKKPYVAKNLFDYPENINWRNRALKQGCASLISLPLTMNENMIGILNIYAKEKDVFNSEEVKLLAELAGDLTFGIHVLRAKLEHKRSEEEKEKMQAQLHQARKMEAIGILAGGIAHDFNNLLTAIQVSADLAMMEVDESDPLFSELKDIQVVAAHAADVARQLLLFSRKHPMEPVTLNLNKTIENLSKMLHRLIGEDVKIKTDLDKDLWMLQADRGTIEQVVMNLAVNARDAMNKGGVLTIKTENIELDEELCKSIPESTPGSYVRLSVSDTGVGMKQEIIEHIFEPFYSSKPIGQGTGLGLSVVYGIIKQHEGSITVRSKVKKGTVFEIYLPAFFGDLQKKEDEEISMEYLNGKGKRILVVEDEKTVRDYVKKGLNRIGYDVYSAANAEEALCVFEDKGGDFDMVVSDVVLPDTNGIDLVDQLLLKRPGLRVLLSSGYTDHKSRWKKIKDRGFRFLQKPYDLMDLLRVIQEEVNS